MGLIKALKDTVSGTLADQWLDVFEADNMGDTTVFVRGKQIRRGSNRKGSMDVITNESVIHVYPNQFMMLVDGGKIIDYSAEPGYYKVDNKAAPSMFNGEFRETLNDSFERFKFGGMAPRKQEVYFINLQEIKGIKFGTVNPINYFDSFYNAELFLRCHGTYSIRITDPLKFYSEVIPKNQYHVDMKEVNEQYMSEFLSALQSSINQMSADGTRISFVSSKSRELGNYMSVTLDDEWKKERGFEIQAVGISSISYTDDSQKLINLRNKGAMLGDPSIREGYIQGQIADGIKEAGSNGNGSMAGFMGMNMGMQTAGGFMGVASASNMNQMQKQQSMSQKSQNHTAQENTVEWICTCGTKNTGRFCQECGTPKPEKMHSWTCKCGNVNTGKFCPECGAKKPEELTWNCTCGTKNTGKFCSNCGKQKTIR